jgi:hypothetical protein
MISITSSSGPMRWTAWRSQYGAFGDLTAAPAAEAPATSQRGARSLKTRLFPGSKNCRVFDPANLQKQTLNQHISAVHFRLYGTSLFVPNHH